MRETSILLLELTCSTYHDKEKATFQHKKLYNATLYKNTPLRIPLFERTCIINAQLW